MNGHIEVTKSKVFIVSELGEKLVSVSVNDIRKIADSIESREEIETFRRVTDQEDLKDWAQKVQRSVESKEVLQSYLGHCPTLRFTNGTYDVLLERTSEASREHFVKLFGESEMLEKKSASQKFT